MSRCLFSERQFSRLVVSSACLTWLVLTASQALVWGQEEKKAETRAASTASTAEAAIRQALDKPVTCEFVETPLYDVVEYLRDYCDIEIQFDHKTLNDLGIDLHGTAITFHTQKMTLRSALKHMLRTSDLGWIVADESLLITSREVCDRTVTSQLYDVKDLLEASQAELGTQPDPLNYDYEALILAIVSAVRPNSWSQIGGVGQDPQAVAAQAQAAQLGIEGSSIRPLFGALVVSQTEVGHEQVANFLQQVRKMRSARGK